MSLESLVTYVPIVIICYLIGMVCKTIKKIKDNVIPIIVSIAGGVIGVIALYTVKDYPANDIITAISVGISSGLVSTGANQIYKQLKKLKFDSSE